MKIRDAWGDKHNLSLDEIESIIKRYKVEYPYKDLEINVDERNGYTYVSLWLDDCDVEIHIMDIYPTKKEFKKIDNKGICGKRLGHLLYCKLTGVRCNSCRKCLKFIEGDD